MKSRQLILIVALVLAVGTGFLTFSYLKNVGQVASDNAAAQRTVWVASQDIQARSVLDPKLFTEAVRPSSAVDRDAIADIKKVSGAVALVTIPAGSIVTQSRLGKAEDAALPVRLQRGQRALTIPVDPVRGVAGLVEPGDRVDVLAVTHSSVTGTDVTSVQTVLHDILVLAMGQTMEHQANPQANQSGGDPATTATLALTPHQAELLTLADSVGTLRLALRSPKDNSRTAPDGMTFATPKPTAAPPQAAAAPVVAPAPVTVAATAAPTAAPKRAPQQINVTVIDGDKVVGSQH